MAKKICDVPKKSSSLSRDTNNAVVYPMMPRGYTATKRAKLRQFERKLLAGKKISIG